MLNDDIRWPWGEIDGPWLEKKAMSLEEQRTLHGDSCKFFVIAGSLFRFARYDYALGSVAFFHAILGLERALKMHYQDADGYLKALMTRAVAEGVFTDSIFGEMPKFAHLDEQISRAGGKKSMSHCERLCLWLPEQRNLYFHGTYLLSPDHYHLTLQLRMMADRLDTYSIFRRPA